jgi:hypothetical protein
MSNNFDIIKSKLKEYQQKYYSNELFKALFLSAAILLAAFFVLNTLEFFGHFGTTVRAMLFTSFFAVFLYVFLAKLWKPISYFASSKKPLSDTDFAQQIGNFFPEIKDKLLNSLQLNSQYSQSQNELILASIAQKTKDLQIVKFTDAINVQQKKKYAKYALVPAIIITALLAFYPPYLVESSKRIVDFKNEYAEPAPFNFIIKNKNLTAFKNEDFNLVFDVKGTVIPENVFLVLGEKRILIEKDPNGQYSYVFRNIQKSQNFSLEAAGFTASERTISIKNRPSLSGIKVLLTYPAYLQKQNTKLDNAGSLVLPQGTIVRWQLGAENTDSVNFYFNNKIKIAAEKALLSDNFELNKQIFNDTDYQVRLYNEHSSNLNPVNYSISVIQDQHPNIQLEQFKDTTLFNYVVLGGKISDDYGLTALKIHYNISRQNGKNNAGSINIPIDKSQNIQSYYYSWMLDSLKLSSGDKLNYYVQVWDNDGIHGHKASKTEMLEYKIPGKEDIDKNIEKSLESTENQLEKAMKEAAQLKKELQNLEQKLKNSPELNHQDKKQLEELMKKREELMNELRQLQEKNKLATEQQKRFQQLKPELAQKFDQLDKLLKDMLNDENKKLYENLKEMLDKNQNEKMLDELDKLKNKERNLEKDIDRAMKLFKKLEKEQKIDKAIKDLLQQAENQEKLAEETEKLDENEKKNPEENNKKQEELSKKQEELQKKFDQTKQDLKDAEKLSEELKEEEKFDGDKKAQEEISKEQQESKEQLSKKDNKKASDSQKKASKKMKNLAEKLANEKQDAESQQMEEDEDALRQILENLVKLSFDQEQLMKDFRNIRVGDPRFLKLAQQQIKLKDDAKVIEDSLYALANRVFQIQSFITKELGLMKYHMDGSTESIKDRSLNSVSTKQQFAMTSMNNLALMLSDALKDMQMSMMEMSGKGKPKKKKKSTPLPMMSKMQSELNKKMQGTTGKDGKGKKGQKGENGTEGSEGAEQLAKLAAEQAKIRKMIQELMESQQGTEFDKKMGEQLKDLVKKMDQTETDIVNKNITPQTLKRQQEIEVRLLESEKALKEQEQDEHRKANTAQDIPKTIPKELELYIKNKQKQTELIRQVPPNLSGFYKKEVDAYYKRINK